MVAITSVDLRAALWLLALLSPLSAWGAGPGGLSPSDAPGCTLCHMSWMPAWREAEVYTLLPEAEAPSVNDEAACFGCHDGAVSDARLKVWGRTGHEAGQPVPAHMRIPEGYPLVDGKLACQTCHTAHNTPEATSAHDAVTVRGEVEGSRMCLDCHGARIVDPQHGAHPVGAMKRSVPEALREAGGRVGEGAGEIHCQTCHMPHGTPHERLLVVTAEGDALCAHCHPKQRSGGWHPPTKDTAPPKLDASGLRATRYLHTRAGGEGELLCLSCHRMHAHEGSPETRFALAQPLANPASCLACHLDKQALLISPHDLRRSAPEYQNAHGQTPAEAGPCGSCHLFHERATVGKGDRADPTGMCNPCHKGDGVGVEAGPVIHGHPVQVRMRRKIVGIDLPLGRGKRVTCNTCHDPHAPPGDNFLRAPAHQLCLSCHPKQHKQLKRR